MTPRAVGLVLADADGASSAVARSLAALRGVDAVLGVLVAHPGRPLADDLHAAIDEAVAAGGPDGAVVLHDPTCSPVEGAMFARGLEVMGETACTAVVAAAGQTDTLKLATASGMVERTIERSGTCDIRTPQIYRAGDLRAALARIGPEVVERAIRDGDHAFLPGQVEGTVRVLAVSPGASRPAAPRHGPDQPGR